MQEILYSIDNHVPAYIDLQVFSPFLNNFHQYSMLNPGPLASYIGFTEDEVSALCQKYGQNFEEVRRWYDGYLLGNYHVYNPNAVTSLLLDGTFQSYWSETSTYDSMVPFINMDFDGLKTAILEMLSGAAVPVMVTSFKNDMVSFVNKDDVLTLLIHLGYLAYNQQTQMAYIPNENRYSQMEYRRCGNSGLKLPLLSLGLWHNFGDTNSLERMAQLCETAFDGGITHFDLANNYGPPAGAAERNFGRLLKTIFAGHRDELVISTKAGYDMWDGPYGDGGSRKYR